MGKLNRPYNITGFRALGKKKLGKRTAEEAFQIYQERQKNKQDKPDMLSVSQWMREGRKVAFKPNHIRYFYLEESDSYSKIIDDPRKKNWSSPLATFQKSYIKTEDCGRYSSRCTYTKYQYRRCIESWGALVNGKLYFRVAVGRNQVKSGFLKAPRGWKFDIDKNGFRIVSKDGKKDYHPTWSTVRADDPVGCMVMEAKRNYQLRKEEEKKLKQEKKIIREADKLGVMVCLRDSITVGNCLAGSLNWARSHGFDPKTHVKPSKLLEKANGEYRRVALVIASAVRRHKKEVEQGFSNLADHTV